MCENSTYSSLYKMLHELNYVGDGSLDLPYCSQRILAQVRTSGFGFLKLTVKGMGYRIKTDALCSLCNLNKNEDLQHILLECPVYESTRAQFLPIEVVRSDLPDNSKVCALISPTSTKLGKDLYYFFVNSLKIRSFILSE